MPNQKVNKGDILIRYDDDETKLRISSLNERLLILQNELQIIRRAYMARLNQLKDKYNIDSNILERYKTLLNSGTIS